MKIVNAVCFHCRKEFLKPKKEYDRRIRNGQNIFCGHSCASTHGNLVNPRKGNVANLKSDNRKDDFSPFRYYRNKARSTERLNNYGKTDLSLEYLKDLWEAQKGVCPYTQKLMSLPVNTREHNIKATPAQASLDRIDSTKGYVQGNVEFVCYAVNLAKNSFSREQMIAFFQNS